MAFDSRISRRKDGSTKQKSDLRDYFRRLEAKNIRPEKVAADIGRSFSTISAWKYGRSKPDHIAIHFLEQRYGVKVA